LGEPSTRGDTLLSALCDLRVNRLF
jgi:hypothetical protein